MAKKKIRIPGLIKFLRERNLPFDVLDRKEIGNLQANWESVYASGVSNSEKRECRMDQHPWHLFSFEIVPHLEGDEAQIKYGRKKDEDLLIFDLFEKCAVKCKTNDKPDLGSVKSDIYVCPDDYRWTMVFTHETGWCGPYYCDKNMLQARRP